MAAVLILTLKSNFYNNLNNPNKFKVMVLNFSVHESWNNPNSYIDFVVKSHAHTHEHSNKLKDMVANNDNKMKSFNSNNHQAIK